MVEVGSFFSCYHNYNNGRFGFVFFLVTISTLGGGIYLCFLSWCNDEKEQQVFDKGWNFGVLELACFISSLSKGLQEHCNKSIWNCCQSFNAKGKFFKWFFRSEWHMGYSCLVPIIWDFPNIKVWLSLPVLLDIEKIEIQKQTRNSSCFGVAQSDN